MDLSILEYRFFQNALLGMVLIAVASAMVGTYIVTRRMVFISGGITHACFGGLGLGCYLGVSPFGMAALFAVGSSLGVGWLARRRVRTDSAIAVIWAVGMAAGILFVFLSEGYVPELTSFLFGNVLTISRTDILLFLGFTLLLALFYILFFRPIVAVSFDQDFSRVAGLPVKLINGVMTVAVALAIVLTIRMIGVMLLMSLMSLPQLTAELFCRRFRPMMLLSCGVALAECVAGLFLSYYISVPASAAIVLLMAAAYGAAAAVRALRERVRRGGTALASTSTWPHR